MMPGVAPNTYESAGQHRREKPIETKSARVSHKTQTPPSTEAICASHLPLSRDLMRNEKIGRRFFPESPRTTTLGCARSVVSPSSASASSLSLFRIRHGGETSRSRRWGGGGLERGVDIAVSLKTDIVCMTLRRLKFIGMIQANNKMGRESQQKYDPIQDAIRHEYTL